MDQFDNTTNKATRGRGQHLTFEDRCKIEVLRKLSWSLRAIAEEVGCSPSTVLYELRRGTPKKNGVKGRPPIYKPARGQAVYEEHRKSCRKKSVCLPTSPFIRWTTDKVRNQKWSFDACVGYARLHNLFPNEKIPCTKTLYYALWKGRLSLTGFDLPEALSRNTSRHIRCRQHKRLMGTSIEKRPEYIAKREEFGHWEIDTVVGKRNGKESVVLTLVEKKTTNFVALKIRGKNSDSVMDGMKQLQMEYGSHFHDVFKSITADNGREFERLSELESGNTKVYFAHPYSSWERPQNERHNRILRRYIPKGVSIRNYTSDQVLTFADEMNSLPRKALNYLTPEELYERSLDEIYRLSTSAA